MTEFPDTQSMLLANIQSLENREAWAEFVQIYRPVIYRYGPTTGNAGCGRSRSFARRFWSEYPKRFHVGNPEKVLDFDTGCER